MPVIQIRWQPSDLSFLTQATSTSSAQSSSSPSVLYTTSLVASPSPSQARTTSQVTRCPTQHQPQPQQVSHLEAYQQVRKPESVSGQRSLFSFRYQPSLGSAIERNRPDLLSLMQALTNMWTATLSQSGKESETETTRFLLAGLYTPSLSGMRYRRPRRCLRLYRTWTSWREIQSRRILGQEGMPSWGTGGIDSVFKAGSQRIASGWTLLEEQSISSSAAALSVPSLDFVLGLRVKTMDRVVLLRPLLQLPSSWERPKGSSDSLVVDGRYPCPCGRNRQRRCPGSAGLWVRPTQSVEEGHLQPPRGFPLWRWAQVSISCTCAAA